MRTKTVTLKALDGTSVEVRIPVHVPTQERGEVLRALYKEYVKSLATDGHWKGPCVATVPAVLAPLVAEAMDFMGSIVDTRETQCGMVRLYSRGYWEHGF